MSDLKEDIGYVRRLVEDGQRGPIVSGLFLASAGIVFGLACFIQWATICSYLPDGGISAGRFWLVVSGLYTLIWLALFAGIRRHQTARSSRSDQIFGAVWGCVALGIITGGIALAIVSARSQSANALGGMMAPMVFAFYGTGWCLSAAFAKRRWMYAISATCLLFTLLLAVTSNSIGQLVVMGSALLLTLGLPGLYLMREKA